MLFTDDEARHKFHTANTLLQVICHMIETELAAWHLQLEFIDVEFNEKQYWEALLVVGNENFEDSPALQESFKWACEKVNSRFKRHDGLKTVTIDPGNFGLLTVRVTDAFALAQVN